MRFLYVIAVAALASCAEQRPIDCSRYEGPATVRCMEENRPKGNREMLLKCLPFSEPLKITGLWVVGFEKNAFFEGGRSIGTALITQHSDTALVTDDDVRSTAPYDALEVELMGRRSLCKFTEVTPHLIVADDLKVKSRRRLVAQ